jgi:hypothetical protein
MDFVLFTPQNEKGSGEVQVVVWRQGGITLWADVTKQSLSVITHFIHEVAREHAADMRQKLGMPVQVEPRIVAEGCAHCSPSGPPCRQCLSTEPNDDDWDHLPGWWDRVDLPELRDEVILARAEGVRQGQAPSIIDMEAVWAEGTKTRRKFR